MAIRKINHKTVLVLNENVYQTQVKMKALICLILLSVVISCGEKEIGKNIGYRIVVSENNNEYIAYIKERSDTLRLITEINGTSKVNKIVIDNEAKDRIKKLFQYQFQIDKFDSDRSGKEESNSVIFELANSEELFLPHHCNLMTSEYWGINKNEDVSKEYAELVTYLKLRYRPFIVWPT